jgi:hypothetical protein
MKNITFKGILLGLFLGAIFMIPSCDIIEPIIASWCEEHQEIDYCESEYPNDVPPLTLPQQSIACGGAGNTVADEDLDWQWIAYTDTLGNKVIGHRMIFIDTSGNQLFTSKFGNYEINDIDKKGYIVDYSDPNRELYYKLELMEVVDLGNEMFDYLFHQWVEAPGINGNPNWSTNIYPQTPVRIEECEGWANIGDFKGITII